MSIIGWFKKRKKKKEKEDQESIETAIVELQKIIEELPPPKTPTKFDIFLQTIEKIVEK